MTVVVGIRTVDIMWFSLAVLALLAAGTVGPIAVWIALARVGRGMLGFGIAAAIGVNLLAVFGWMLSGMSEYPNNSTGHPDRVHVTNASGSTAVLVLNEPTEVRSGSSLRRLPADERTIIPGAFHAVRVGDVCLDRPTWIVPVGPETAASAGRDERVEFTADELRSAVRLDDCHARGDHFLLWDGSATTPDPSWDPPLIHPSHTPLAAGGAWAGIVLAVAAAVQSRLDRRRSRRAQSSPCSTA